MENVIPQKHFMSFYSQYDLEMNVFKLETCFMLHRTCFSDSPVGMHHSVEVLKLVIVSVGPAAHPYP